MPGPPPVRPRRADERRYLRALRALLDPTMIGLRDRLIVAGGYVEALRILANTPVAPDEEIPGLAREQIEAIDEYHRNRTLATLGRALVVDIRPLLTRAAVRPFIEERIAENVSLIRTIEPRYHAALRQDITQLQADTPFDRQALRRLLARDYRSAGKNLKRLTRDQNNKMVGQLTEIRQRQVGVAQYIWRTSEDERVRQDHRVKNGRRIRWDDPPTDTGHPGQDIQCRCVAQAVIESAQKPE